MIPFLAMDQIQALGIACPLPLLFHLSQDWSHSPVHNKRHSVLRPYLTAAARVALIFWGGKQSCVSASEHSLQPGCCSPKTFSKYLLLPLPAWALASSQWGGAGSQVRGLFSGQPSCKRNNPSEGCRLSGAHTDSASCWFQAARPFLVREQKLMLPKSYLLPNLPKSVVTLSSICFRANLLALPWVGRNALRDPERIRRGIVSIPAMPLCNYISAGHSSCPAWDKGWKQPAACLK